MNNHNLTPEQTVADLARLAWCALVALHFARRDGLALSPLTEHTFLLRWLAIAQKQRRFPRTVAPDIDSLLKLGRQKGPTAGLYQRLKYLWESCSSPVKQQSDLFRLTYAIETLKTQGWINAAITDGEWDIPALLTEYDDVSALLVKKSDLMQHFADDGQLIGAIEFAVKGQFQVVSDAFNTQNLHHSLPEPDSGEVIMILEPARESVLPV